MPKKIVQDVLPPESKSIRNIPIPSTRRRTPSATQTPPAPQTSSYETPVITPRPRAVPPPPPSFQADVAAASVHIDSRRDSAQERIAQQPAQQAYNSEPPRITYKRNRSKKGFWALVGVAVLILAFSISFLFVSAHVEITPKTEQANLNSTIVAKKTPAAGELGYDVVTLSKEFGKTVEASGEETVQTKASGKITIFNETKTAQKLIANTRFETPGGLIYRIAEAVTIPAATTKGAEMVPGSVTVTVTADQAGEKYNIALNDFTIPGFKGDPRFDTIYARSQSLMQGGKVGTVKKVVPATLTSAQEEIRTTLREELMKEVALQIPDSYILYPGAVSFTFESMPQTNITDASVQVNEKGTISGIILDKEALNAALAGETLTQTDPGEVYVSNIENLDLSLPSGIAISTSQSADITLTMKGSASFVWALDQEKIKKDLASKPKKNLGTILSTHPAVDKAKVTLRPFWKRSFPSDVRKIEIEVKTP